MVVVVIVAAKIQKNDSNCTTTTLSCTGISSG
jgi:hypothetical protein